MIHRWRMRRILMAYAEGTLSPDEHRVLTRHLERCPLCRKTLHTWREADRLLQDAGAPAPRLSEDAANAIFQRALAQAGRRAYQPTSWLLPALGGTALACVALAFWPHPHLLTGSTEPSALSAAPFPAPGPMWIGAPVVPLRGQVPDASKSAISNQGAVSSQGAAIPWLPSALFPASATSQAQGSALAARSPLHRHRNRPLRRNLEPQSARLLAMEKAADTQAAYMFIAVTHEQEVALDVTHVSADTPGYAHASCMRSDEDGNATWTSCTISSDLEANAKIEFQQTHSNPDKPGSILKVVLLSGDAAKEPGGKP